MQCLQPREGKLEDVATWIALLAHHSSFPTPMAGPARVDRQGEPQTDLVARPAAAAELYTIRKAWRASLSDHSVIFADPHMTAPARRADVLAPGAFRSSPEEARADRRRCHSNLERMFDIPAVDLSGIILPADWAAASRPGGLPPERPAGPTPAATAIVPRGQTSQANRTALRAPALRPGYPLSCSSASALSPPRRRPGGRHGAGHFGEPVLEPCLLSSMHFAVSLAPKPLALLN